ncbi:EAL domain-containing protein [Pseudoalteromonas fenneropenaei]|uniref:EAL domain-containing protein n=1 Tax=Pseudoalteromonas fenneropenaei TaxID=1737459 RepID=A0ABV7CJU9_9GAMM
MTPFRLKNMPSFWLLIGALVFVSSLASYVYWSYQHTRQDIMREIDTRLLHAAKSVTLLLGEGYHDQLAVLDSTDYEQASNKLSTLAKTLEVEYLYAMYYEAPNVHFSASSFTEYDHKTGRISRFKDIYQEATTANVKAFSSTTPIFEISEDQWGKFKSVFVPHISPKGQIYITGADITIADLEQKLAQSARQAGFTASFFFFIAALVGFLYFVTYRRTLQYDPSSGYPNRTALMRALQQRQFQHVTVAVVWVKDLEDIIGFYGLSVAEQVMLKLMDHFATRAEPNSVFRLATGKCAILVAQQHEANLLEILRQFPAYSPIISNPHVCVRLHIGVATGNANMVLENAYIACRQAKQQGEFLRVYCEDSMATRLDHKNHLILTNSLHRAIESQHVQPFFEPRCDSEKQQVQQIACNARIFNEFGQLLVAKNLDPILNNSGLISQLDQLLLRLCMERFRKLNLDWSMAISLNAVLDPHFIELMHAELRRYPVPQRIQIELQEQDLLSHFSALASFISQLKSKGVKVMICNVSSGLMAVTRVSRLKIDAISLAPQITDNIADNSAVLEFVQHMAIQCNKAGIILVATNVRNDIQFNLLTQAGVKWVQGPYVGATSPHLPINLAEQHYEARA